MNGNMKILVLVGSSFAGGNTEKLAERFADGARDAGHAVEFFRMSRKHVNYCLGCNACVKTGNCFQQDDMQEFYRLFLECDVIVFASPLYFWGISAQTKAVIDRLYALGEKSPKGYFSYPKKKSMLLVTAADSDSHFWTFESAVQYYERLAAYMRWISLGVLKAGSCGGTSQERNIELTGHLERAYQLGKSLLALS